MGEKNTSSFWHVVSDAHTCFFIWPYQCRIKKKNIISQPSDIPKVINSYFSQQLWISWTLFKFTSNTFKAKINIQQDIILVKRQIKLLTFIHRIYASGKSDGRRRRQWSWEQWSGQSHGKRRRKTVVERWWWPSGQSHCQQKEAGAGSSIITKISYKEVH